MSLADEIAKLDSLRQAGVLSEDEFQKAKTRLLAGDTPTAEPSACPSSKRRWRKKPEGAFIAGVCAGIADSTSSPTWLWQVVFIVTALGFGDHGGFALGLLSPVTYLLLALFMPKE